MNIINKLLKHPFINKTGLASVMRPMATRETAQKTISARIANNTEHPEEEVRKALSELENLNKLIEQVLKAYSNRAMDRK